MARGDFKANPSAILSAHWRTYIDKRTGLPLADRLAIDGVPVAVGVASALFHLHLPGQRDAGLLTVSGLLSAFLFALMLQVADSATSLAESEPVPGRETSEHAIYLGSTRKEARLLIHSAQSRRP